MDEYKVPQSRTVTSPQISTSKAGEYITDWEDRIALGKAFKDQHAFAKDWNLYEQYYKGQFGEAIQPANIIFPLIRSTVPRVYFRDPKVVITPMQPGYGVQAKMLEAIDNWLIRQIRMKKAMKSIVQDACLYGTGIGKSGYDSEYGFSEEKKREASDQDKFFQKTGKWQADLYVSEWNEAVMPGMPWYQRVSPKQACLPWGCQDVKNASWVSCDYLRHIDDIKKDPKYRRTDRVSPNRTIADKLIDDHVLAQAVADRANAKTEYVLLREIVDLRRKRVYVYAVGHDFWLRNDPDPLLSAGNYYDFLQFNENIDCAWGISDVHELDSHQRLINEVNTQFYKHIKLQVLKLLVRANVLTPGQLKDLENGDVGTILQVVTTEDLRNIIMPFLPPADYGLAQAMQIIRGDAREVVGFSRNEAGQYDTSSRRTATEAEYVHQANMIRVDERRDASADLFVDAIRRLNQYIFKYWTEEKYAQVLGPNGQQFWIPYNGEMLRGDYFYQIDPDTTQPRSSQIRKGEALEVMQILAKFPPEMLAQLGYNLKGILDTVLDSYTTIDLNRILVPVASAAAEGQKMSMQDFQAMVNGGMQNANLPTQM